MPPSCPTVEQLAAALRRPSSPSDAELAAHLTGCPACRKRLEEMAGGTGWLPARAKPPTKTLSNPKPDSLEKAMRSLESRSSRPEVEAMPPLRLDFLQPSDQPGVLGRFGPYEVLAQVAVGGMGIVLKARDPGLDRIVALKILPPVLAANSLARARFIREARTAAAVVHEHVVPIYAVDESAGLPYLVMQFIQGRPLSERIRATGPLRLEEVLRIGSQTALGLAAAHAQGLIHRDVKPGNILLENSVERVKITDFGLARAADDSSLTRDGYIAGTPEYMSPEQANNGTVDQRADLFGFGCVLYEMATGVSPFRAEKPLVALRRVCDEEPPPAHTLNPNVPEWLSQLIQRLMAKNAGSRPQTAAEVATELGRRLAECQQIPTAGSAAVRLHRTAPKYSRRQRAVLFPGLIVTIPALLTLAYWLWPRDSSEVSRLRVTPSKEIRLAAVPSAQDQALFFIPASGGVEEQGFASLAEAVESAPSGAAIECRFNGLQEIEPVRRIEKALVLRAAPGFEPVLTAANRGAPILFMRAALVVEGLKMVTRSSRAAGPPRPSLGAAVSVEDAPFLAAHCRFEVLSDSNPSDRRQPHGVRLINVPAARFLNCEIVSRKGFGLDWIRRPSLGAPEQSSRVLLQGCTLEGNLVTTEHRGGEAIGLELHQNTLVGDALLWPKEPSSGRPLEIKASRNIFAMETLIRPIMSARDSTLEQLLQWTGDANIYSVKSYVQSSPPPNRHEDWLASTAIVETNSLSTEMGIKTRLAKLIERTHATEAAALALTVEERQRLTAQGWANPEPPGADTQRNGPGKSYHDWRISPAYQEWLQLVRRLIPEKAEIR